MLDCGRVDEGALELTEAGVVDPLRDERGSASLWRGSLALDALEKANGRAYIYAHLVPTSPSPPKNNDAFISMGKKLPP